MEKISCSRLNLIRIDNSKLVSFNPQKVSKIKYPRVSVSCSLQLEGGSSSTTILLRRFDSLFSDKLSFLTYTNNTDEEKSDIIDVLDLSLIIDHHNFKICGHSHGIVCLYNHLGIFLFNPVTMEFRRLPPSIFKHNDDNVDSDYFRFQVGFGYDPKSKDLKVVRVSLSGVEVYDLSTDRWRELKTRMFEVGFIDSQMYHNGFYYWSGDKSSNGEHVILSFDMSKEVFQLIPMPRNYKMDLATNISLLAWNGSIVMYAMYVTDDRYTDTEIDIWAMENNYDGRVSWSKLLTMNFETPNLSFRLTPLLILNSYELLLVDRRNYQHLISVNIKTHRAKHLKDVTGLPDKMQAFVFEKSLLSVKGGTHLVP